ncbi:MAG: IS607 family transposase [Candidatus Paceibacterota bacterium]|jgi:predicted site-specific integrase-resolvase
MKLSQWAKNNSLSYQTALNHWRRGLINGKQLATGTIVVFEDDNSVVKNKMLQVATYARVSSSENKENLETQHNRLIDYANAKGYKTLFNVKEIGSGLNDNRKKLNELLLNKDIDIIIVEHKDRLTRFGFNYIKLLLENQERKIEIINNIDNDKNDLIQDFISIITSFCARIYGQRRSKRNTEKIIKELNVKSY